MEYLTASEIAAKWNVSEQLVRRHCRENRIPDAYQEFGTWYIPADAEKPARKQKEVKPTPILLKKILKQRDGKQYVVTYITHSWGGAAQFAELAEKQKKIIVSLN